MDNHFKLWVLISLLWCCYSFATPGVYFCQVLKFFNSYFRYTNAWSVYSTMQGWWKFWGSAVSSLHRILLVCWYWRLGDWRNKDQRNAKLQEKYWICFVEVYLHVYSFWVIMSDTALNGYVRSYIQVYTGIYSVFYKWRSNNYCLQQNCCKNQQRNVNKIMESLKHP